jgi:uncharacterized protein (TIGR00299 family) protein
MQIAILDPAAGISGDMTLGALIAAGVDPGWLRALPERLGFGGVGVEISTVKRCGVAATKVDFVIEDSPHNRSLPALLELVQGAPVSDGVRRDAAEAFRVLGEAEAQVHGVPPDEVHFHEVGAVDSVLDIVGAIEGFEHLGAEKVYNFPAALGSGWVETAHGRLPIPAPATAVLVEGLDSAVGGPVAGEATTPTGAALLRVLSSGAPPSRVRVLRNGWGAGTRDPECYPNALRLLVAEAADEAEQVSVLAADVDDLTPEYLEPLRAAVLAAGALDCQVWPTHGKKGRVGFRIEALAAPGLVDQVEEALFRHSTTAGVRRWETRRHALTRRHVTVDLAAGVQVRVKVLDTPGGARAKAEYDDVLVAARALGLAPMDVARRAQRDAERLADLPDSTKGRSQR